jgi:predicted transcriptional regulator
VTATERSRGPDLDLDLDRRLISDYPSKGRHDRMEKALWYLLTATRGGENRVRLIRALSDRPKNANRLAEELDVSYKTVRHHLDMLEEHGIVEPGDNDYGKLYFLTDQFETNRETFEEITERL